MREGLDTGVLLGSSANVAEVLRKKRGLSKVMIVRLHQQLAIPYEVLLGDIERRQKVRTRKRAVG